MPSPDLCENQENMWYGICMQAKHSYIRNKKDNNAEKHSYCLAHHNDQGTFLIIISDNNIITIKTPGNQERASLVLKLSNAKTRSQPSAPKPPYL